MRDLVSRMLEGWGDGTARGQALAAGHLAEPLKLAMIAAAFSVGESTLRHAFKHATGRTVADCLEELRATRAKELLRESGLRITDIACRVGYPTIGSFSRAFKRFTGMSPGDYSRSIR